MQLVLDYSPKYVRYARAVPMNIATNIRKMLNSDVLSKN